MILSLSLFKIKPAFRNTDWNSSHFPVKAKPCHSQRVKEVKRELCKLRSPTGMSHSLRLPGSHCGRCTKATLDSGKLGLEGGSVVLYSLTKAS